MKKFYTNLFTLLIILTVSIQLAYSQVPESFSYQAVVRDGTGAVIINRAVKFRITLQDETGTNPYYSEKIATTTNDKGVVNFNIGSGTPVSGTIKGVPWKSGSIFIKIEIDPNGGDSFVAMGTPAKLQAVPYALFAGNTKEIISDPSPVSDEEPIFVVKNKDGKIVFAVYQSGVRAYVDDSGSKGVKSGFAIGGLTNQGKAEVEYFKIYPDSARMLLKEPAKGAKGGFAIGGLTNKSTQDLMLISPDSARIWVKSESAKGAKGGFAIGGLTNKGTASNFILLTPENYFIGHQAGGNTTTGLYNSFFGYQSGYSNTQGNKNVFLGRYTGYNNITGNQNIFIGDSSGYNNTEGNANLFLGVGSGAGNQSGFWNIFLGRRSGYLNTTGYANIIAGDFAGYSNTSGSYNVFLGDYSGAMNTIGSKNVFIGKEAGWSNTEGEKNIFIGAWSGFSTTTGNWNVFMGENSGYNNETGVSNIMIGQSAGHENTTGPYNVMLGTLSGYSNTEGRENTFLGQETGYSNTTGNYNTIAGSCAGYSNTTGSWNTFNGFWAGRSNTTGQQNVMLGQKAGFSNTTGGWNVYIGPRAGYNNSEGSQNVFIGNRAGYKETGSNKLYISNTDVGSDTALIYGDFYNQFLRFNANTAAIDSKQSNDNIALIGHHNVTPYYGIGVEGRGGYIGVRGVSDLYSGNGYRYGVYGYAYGGYTNWAGYFNGYVYATSYYNSSDKNLKNNIQTIPTALKKIMDLNGVTFEWKTESELENIVKQTGKKDPFKMNLPVGLQYGVVAQDVEKVLPELVNTDADGLKSVDYVKIIPVLIEAIKEQQKQIELLKGEVELLKTKK